MAAARRHFRNGPPSIEEQLDREAREARAPRESGPDLVDVPAAIICTRCGEADCGGNCESDLSRSGVVSVVAWERPGLALTRLWSTARATTRDAEAFFELLPDGPIAPALRFAAICDFLAVSALFLCVVVIAAVVAPSWLKHVVLDPQTRWVALRVLIVGLPAFAGLLIGAHVAHGLSLDIGATRNGGRPSRSRALRFGLYSCGWDLVLGPIGIAVIAVKEGLSKLSDSLTEVPHRSSLAFLRGCYRLDGVAISKALATASIGSMITKLVLSVFVLVALVAIASV